jgi:hypothetical protein
MANAKHRYQAYLLRLWQETSAGQPVWRISLEDPHTGVRQGFADLEQLFAFLMEQTKEADEGQSHRSPLSSL